MSELIDKISAHLDSIERKAIEVPEWDVTLYSDPVTGMDQQALEPYLRRSPTDFAIEVIVRKAMTEDGKPAFGKEDKPKLKRLAQFRVIDRIANAIWNEPYALNTAGES